MSERNVDLLLNDILDAIGYIRAFTDGMTYESYLLNLQTKHAVCHNFTIIGEAASKIPKDFRELHPDIAWQSLKDFRNFIVHEYFGLDDSIVWSIIKNDLEALMTQITLLLKKEN